MRAGSKGRDDVMSAHVGLNGDDVLQGCARLDGADRRVGVRGNRAFLGRVSEAWG